MPPHAGGSPPILVGQSIPPVQMGGVGMGAGGPGDMQVGGVGVAQVCYFSVLGRVQWMKRPPMGDGGRCCGVAVSLPAAFVFRGHGCSQLTTVRNVRPL